MKEKLVKLKNAEVYYWQNEQRKGRTGLLLIHGFRGDHNGLRFIAEYLVDDYNITIPDLPGFGKSSEFREGKHDLENYVEILEDFIGAAGLRQPVVVAHSFGTILSSRLAEKTPELISDKLILICPIAKLATKGVAKKITDMAIAAGRRLPGGVGKRITGSKLVADAVTLKMTRTKDVDLKRRVKEEHRKYFGDFSSNKSMLEGLTTSNNHHVGMFADKVGKNVLVVATELDDFSSIEDQQKLAKQFARGQIKIIRGTGHLVHYEKPEDVAGAVRKFVS